MADQTTKEPAGEQRSSRAASPPIAGPDAAGRSLIGVLRGVFFALTLVLAVLIGIRGTEAGSDISAAIPWWGPLVFGIVVFALTVAIDLFTPNKKVAAVSAIFFGTVVGVLSAVAIGFVFDLVIETRLDAREAEALSLYTNAAKFLVGVCVVYLAISTILQTQDDFRLVIPYVEFAKQLRGPTPFVLDSSALIDARVVDLAQTGLLQAPLVVPEFVIAELQLLADSSDRLKRTKGRRGLDVIAQLQRRAPDVIIEPDRGGKGVGVDRMLVDFAARLPATIVTTDTGLARVASIQSVRVLNINDVAGAMRPSVTPGQRFAVRFAKVGEQPGQAVGYMEDGTMVVVGDAAPLVGQEREIEVTSSMQTSAGRLVFAQLIDTGDEAPSSAGDTPPPDPSAVVPKDDAQAQPARPGRPRGGNRRNPRRGG